MYYQSQYQSPLGEITLVSDEEALRGLWFAEQKYYGLGYVLAEIPVGETAVIQETKAYLDHYFAGRRVAGQEPKWAIDTTPFRLAVYQELAQVPYGEKVSYQSLQAAISRAAGRELGSARAIGGAVGHNPIAIIIPCHRVLAKNGQLTGYAGGLSRKQALLDLEGIAYQV